ncbi:MAG: hypothetical protein A3H41_04925 [Omnitrophica WOR_2 bacterium RIFCSPLOWO2_02_FULL_45_28]|nr:MAG: hypothetical protein A3H41_04925 [Omnitrophica WOR_2 bacterium RIFCSPLOWO2_02_FULL_45_28]
MKMLIIKIKGTTEKDLFKTSISGILERKTRRKISIAYAPKAGIAAGLVKIIETIRAKKLISLILGSRLWMKLFIRLYSSIYECSIKIYRLPR